MFYFREGVLTGPQVRKLFKCELFESKLSGNEKRAWDCIKNVCRNFLGAKKAQNYHQIVDEMILALKDINCNMSLKIHLLHCHVDSFPVIANEATDEQGERFHQDISYMEYRYRGKSTLSMLSDYCWHLARDMPKAQFTRKRKMPVFVATN